METPVRKAVALALLLAVSTPAEAFVWGRKRESPQKTAVKAAKAPVETTLTFRDAFRMAVKRSESLAIHAEDIELARARFYRSFQFFFPRVSYQMTRTERDVDDDGSSSGEGFSSDSRRRTTPEKKFTFSQPIFSGFKEIAALKGSGADRGQQTLEWERARELLFVDVMEAYYAVLQSEKDVSILRATRKALSERLRELKGRVELGRSRDIEMKVSLSDLKLTEADLVGAETAAIAARNLLEFYVGEALGSRRLEDAPVPAPAEEPADIAAQALARSDVQAARSGLRLAENRITSAQAGFFPKVSLDGNYYTERLGFQEGNDWDFTIRVDVPIFDAGATLGDVKEAWAFRDAARHAYSRARRWAELEIRNAWEDYRSAHRAGEAFADAARATEESYTIHTKEYLNNLVSNLDVLDALRRSEEVRRRGNQAEYDSKRSYWQYRVALGDINELI